MISAETLTVVFLSVMFLSACIPVQWDRAGFLYYVSLFPFGVVLMLPSVFWGKP